MKRSILRALVAALLWWLGVVSVSAGGHPESNRSDFFGTWETVKGSPTPATLHLSDMSFELSYDDLLVGKRVFEGVWYLEELTPSVGGVGMLIYQIILYTVVDEDGLLEELSVLHVDLGPICILRDYAVHSRPSSVAGAICFRSDDAKFRLKDFGG